MSAIESTAKGFFEACETGKGWAACQAFCTPDATFSCQADALAEVKTLEAYTEWMKGMFGPIPDGSYALKAWGVDEERSAVLATAVFSGSHSGDGGPVPATGKRVETDYTYVMEFDGGRVNHMTKTRNSNWALQQLGWA